MVRFRPHGLHAAARATNDPPPQKTALQHSSLAVQVAAAASPVDGCHAAHPHQLAQQALKVLQGCCRPRHLWCVW